jgi:acetylornithine deacetylase/succinyl-diaminopimelate desuccinylase-like protein
VSLTGAYTKASRGGTATVVRLMQELIREGCVNDGSDASGQEIRAVRVLQRFFEGSPVEFDVYESLPGRASMVARVRGTDPEAPKLGLLGHIDVVPVDVSGWSRDPFAAEIIDQEVWGRGAVDMLYLTASFATVLREVALADTRPRGDLVFMAVADEEAGSERGLKYLMSQHPEAVTVTEVLGESGGMRVGQHVAIEIGEKGSAGRRIIVRGEPSHASIPYGAKNAIVRMAEVVQLLAAANMPIALSPTWEAFVDARVTDPDVARRLRDPKTLDAALPALGATAGYAHAVTRVTIAPTRTSAGIAHNVTPDEARLGLDIRTLPGVDDSEVDRLLQKALEPVAEHVTLEHMLGWPATLSSADTPLFSAVQRSIDQVAGAPVMPMLAAGGSDCRQYRMLGVPAYGFGVLAPDWTYEKYRSRIHGHDERIDMASIELTFRALREIVSLRIL